MPIILDFFKGGVKWNMTLNVRLIDKGGYYMKGFKKLTAGLMGAVMALGVCGFTALAAKTIPVKTAEELANAVKEDGDITIILDNDIDLKETLEIPNGKNITLDLGDCTLTGPENGHAIRFGNSNTEENSGELEIINGEITSARAIINYSGNIVLGKDLEVISTYGAVESQGGKITIDGAYLYAKGVYIEDDSDKNDVPGYTVTLLNIGKDNEKDSASLLMKKGKIEVGYGIALSGNNTKSAKTKATIEGGTIEGLIGIYWPMEGELNITGGTIKGGTGIEAKMGTITISGDAEIIGTGTHSETEPVNGGSSPEGSAILISAQMYGNDKDNQYDLSNKLTVTIEGGKIESKQGNAITVYNTEKITEQTATIDIEGGEISGENSDIKYISKEKTEAETHVDDNSYTTKKSQTTLTVSSNAAPAAINEGGDTVFYSDVNDAIEAANNATGEEGKEVEVAVYGDAVIDTNVTLKDNVKLVVAPDTELKANISANGDKVIVAEKDENGNTVYKVVEEVENPANYEAKIISGGNTSYFDTLDSAVKTVQDGQTIELLKDCGEAEVTRDVSFYVDDNDFDYKIVAGDGYVNTGRGDEYDFITEEDYEDERDSVRHSYSLKEGKTERDDDEEEPVVTPEPEEEEGPFSDVGKDNPNYDAIVEVYEKGWMAGIADGVFAPNGTLTRGMAVTILWNRAGQPEPANVAPFLDVTSDAWYAKAVAWAYENGITNGAVHKNERHSQRQNTGGICGRSSLRHKRLGSRNARYGVKNQNEIKT